MEEDCNGGHAADNPSDGDAEWGSLMEDSLHCLPECHVPIVEVALKVVEEQLQEEVATRKRLGHKSPEDSGEEENCDVCEF